MGCGKKILISVIMPVYNAEEYIDQAIQSILCQMDGSIELILVDDGSKDRSGSICDAYAAEHVNIRVIHKENGGTSSAKNIGIQASVGDYITFVDSDDYIDSTAYSEIREVILRYNPDCIDFGWRYIKYGNPVPPTFHKLPKDVLLGEKELTELILPPLLNLRWDPDHFVFDFCCNKVFQAEIIRTHGVLFDVEKRVWEDRTFLLRCLSRSKNYYAMNRCFYNYVFTPDSLSQRYTLDFFQIIVANFKHYSELFGDEFDFDTQYANDYWCHAIENMIFRSLEQTENVVQIRQNILQTLTDAQVVHWYAKRCPQNAFEQKMSRLVVSGQCEKALQEYEKQKKRQNNSQRIRKFLSAIKRRVIRKNSN